MTSRTLSGNLGSTWPDASTSRTSSSTNSGLPSARRCTIRTSVSSGGRPNVRVASSTTSDGGQTTQGGSGSGPLPRNRAQGIGQLAPRERLSPPVQADHQQPGVGRRRRDRLQQPHRRHIRPVQVVHDQQQATVPAAVRSASTTSSKTWNRLPASPPAGSSSNDPDSPSSRRI
jgi:hypothetical protein